jgi:hypothetical protein
MRDIGRVPPSLLADSPTGFIHFVPGSFRDGRAKDNFANTARLICIGYEVTAALLVLEAWIKMAKPGETLDINEPPSEAFDRREVVVLTGETFEHAEQRLLPIIRTNAGGFFGLGEHIGPKLDKFEGRFAHLLAPEPPSAKSVESARALLSVMGISRGALRGSGERN